MTSLLANHLWQSTLFAGAAGLLVLALRNNRAQVRYWIWLIASLKFLVPFSAIVALGSFFAPSTTIQTTGAGFSDVVTEIGQPFVAPSVSFAAGHSSTNPVPGILFTLWFCGFLVVAFRWYARWRRVRATVRAARPVALETGDRFAESRIAAQPGAAQNSGAVANTGPGVETSLDAARRSACATFATCSGVRVLSSPALLEPGIFGIFRPVLVMPDGIAERLTSEQLNAILAHELCHVRRSDNLFAALHMLVEAIFWFHPLVWWIGARLVEERERACDEEVLRLGNEPEIYAESILKTCRFYLESPLACMSGVTGADLKKRVVRIMTQRVGQRIGFACKILLAVAGTLAIAGPLAFGVITAPAGRAQLPDAATSGPKPKFEVASIKPDKSGGRNISVRISPGGRIHAINISPKLLIETAYDVKGFQLTGGPKWIDSTRYDIEAKAADSVARNIVKLSQDEQGKQLRLMLQTLLAERFKLKLSRATKELPIYALLVAKHGPKIHPTRLDGLPGMRRKVGFRRGELDLSEAPLSTLADGLSRTLGRAVVDKTGLKGAYDFTLTWTPDERQNRVLQGPPEEAQPAMSSPAPPEASGPSIFTAIQEQLGLKLKAEKGPVEVLVIDHVEQPSAN